MSYYKRSIWSRIKEWAIVLAVVVFFGGFIYIVAAGAVENTANCNGVVIRNYWGMPDCLESPR